VLSDALVSKFGLSYGGDETLWKLADPFNGTSGVMEAGDFVSCAKWGARNDDFLMGGNQVADCFPADKMDLTTLVIITMGGNDLSALTQAAIDGLPDAELWNMTEEIVQNHRDAIEWFVSDPNKFPNGVYVVFSNMFEFTDGTGDVEVCDVSGLAGFDQPVPAPDKLADMVVWANEQYGKTAVDTGTDMIFMLEEFCGHGFNNENPRAPCYRGPGTPRWVDLTCIHPNPLGHSELANMFSAVINE
jgi:lysophospholipase L1-like esterase